MFCAVKRILLIFLISVALNFSYRPAVSVPFEKHRITISVTSEEESAMAESIREVISRKFAIQVSLSMMLINSQISCRCFIDSS